MSSETVREWLETHADEMVEFQTGLSARPALSPDNNGQGEWEKARFIEEYLRRHGLDHIGHFDCPDDRVPEGSRPNLVVTIAGERPSPVYVVLCHMDVVPPGERLPDGSWRDWDSDPYTVHRIGDFLVARGVEDDQQAIVSSVFAARALLETGVQLGQTVKLIMVSDEETGSFFGLRYLLRKHRDIFGPGDAILVPDGGSADSTMMEIAEKTVLWLEFTVRGKQGHTSLPGLAINTARAAARLTYLLDKELNERFDKVDHLYEPPYSTFEPTLHAANVPNVNTIPGEDVFCFDCRILPCYNVDIVLSLARAQCAYVDEKTGTTTEMRIRMRDDAPPPTSPDAPVVRILADAARKVYGVDPVPRGKGAVTVAGPLRKAGLDAVVWMTCLGTVHQANEKCSIRHMIGDARVFAEVFRTPLADD